MTNKYVGWIPNVAGRLSYQAIGKTNYPEKIERSYHTVDNQAVLICKQQRIATDYLIPFNKQFVKFLHQDYVMVLIGQYDCNDAESSLKGNLYFFESEDLWSAIKEYVSNEAKNSSGRKVNVDQPPNYHSFITAAIENFFEINYKENKHLNIILNFCLERNGVVTIEGNGASNNRVHYEEKAYHFLRDIAHSHQHHDASDDNYISVYELSPYDHSLWKENVCRQLFSRIIDMKRHKSEFYARRARGLMAYTLSFIHHVCDGSSKYLKTIQDALESKTLMLSIDNYDLKQTGKIELFGKYLLTILPLIFAFFAVGLSSLAISGDKIILDDTLKKFYIFMANNPISVILAILVIPMLLKMKELLPSQGMQSDFFYFIVSIFRGIYSLLIVFMPKLLYILLMLVVAIVSTYLFYFSLTNLDNSSLANLINFYQYLLNFTVQSFNFYNSPTVPLFWFVYYIFNRDVKPVRLDSIFFHWNKN